MLDMTGPVSNVWCTFMVSSFHEYGRNWCEKKGTYISKADYFSLTSDDDPHGCQAFNRQEPTICQTAATIEMAIPPKRTAPLLNYQSHPDIEHVFTT